jgi:hypothetical protein
VEDYISAIDGFYRQFKDRFPIRFVKCTLSIHGALSTLKVPMPGKVIVLFVAVTRHFLI